MQEFWDHPQLEARGRWREIGTPAGPIEAMKPPFNLDGSSRAWTRCPRWASTAKRSLPSSATTQRQIAALHRDKTV